MALGSQMNLVEAVRECRAEIEWADLISEDRGHRLVMRVFRDAMKVDGIRYPASAREMQVLADLTACSLPTPRILDLVWMQATTRFDPVINMRFGRETKIVADLPPEVVSPRVDERIAHAGGDKGGIIASVGKFWVVSNRLAEPRLLYRSRTACNYGWHSTTGRYPAVTKGLKVWQSPGVRHDDGHVDSSQVVRLVARQCLLRRAGSTVEVEVDLHDVARDPDLCGLVNHDGVLQVLRQPSVPEPQPVKQADGTILMPEIVLV